MDAIHHMSRQVWRKARGLRGLALVLAFVFALAALNGPAAAQIGLQRNVPCPTCQALVISVEAGVAQERRARAEAFGQRLREYGVDNIQTLHDPGIVALDAGIERFMAARGAAAAKLIVWFDGPLDRRDSLIGLRGSDSSGRSAPDMRHALPLTGLFDQVAGTSAHQAVVIINDQIDVAPEGVRVGPRNSVYLLSRSADTPAEGFDELAIRALVSRPPTADQPSDLRQNPQGIALQAGVEAMRMGAGWTNLMASVESGQAGRGALLPGAKRDDPFNLKAFSTRIRQRDWEAVRASGDRDQVLGFMNAYCNDLEWSDVCDLAKREVDRLTASLNKQIAACHRLATHPADPRAAGEGVPEDRLRAHSGEAQRACILAGRTGEETPRILFQIGRVLEIRNNLSEAIKRYREAAMLGYPMAKHAFAMALYRQGGSLSATDRREAERKAAELLKAAGEDGVVDSKLAYVFFLQRGIGLPRPRPDEALRVLEEVAETDPRGKALLAEFLVKDAPSERGVQRAVALFRAALADGLGGSDAVSARKQLAALEAQIAAERERDRAGAFGACAAQLDFDPLEVLAVREIRSVSGNLLEEMRRDTWRRLRRLDIDGILSVCHQALQRGDAPSGLLTRYGFLMAELFKRGRSYDLDLSAWPTVMQRAVAAGDPLAKLFLGRELIRPKSPLTRPDGAQGERYLREALASGVLEAGFYLALEHLASTNATIGFTPNPYNAFEILLNISRSNFPLVYALLASIYSNPENYGISKQYAKPDLASAYARRAAAVGFKFGAN